jgi:hypothetical protein
MLRVSWDEIAGPHMLVDMFALREITVLWLPLAILMVSNFYYLLVIDLRTDNIRVMR